MGYQVGLIDALVDFGLKPTVEPGALTRGSINFDPKAAMAHHTGSDNDITAYLRDKLLCNVEFRRNGHVHVIACGRANHAGRGEWRGLTGNTRFIGVEATSAGKSWTPAQKDRYPLLMAALAHYLGRDETWIADHKAYAGYRGKWDLGAWLLADLQRDAGYCLRHRTPNEEDDLSEAADRIVQEFHNVRDQLVERITGLAALTGAVRDGLAHVTSRQLVTENRVRALTVEAVYGLFARLDVPLATADETAGQRAVRIAGEVGRGREWQELVQTVESLAQKAHPQPNDDPEVTP